MVIEPGPAPLSEADVVLGNLVLAEVMKIINRRRYAEQLRCLQIINDVLAASLAAAADEPEPEAEAMTVH